MAFYSAANHLIDNLSLDHLNSINLNIPVYCTGASAAAPSTSSSSSSANSKASTSTSTMHNHHPNQNQNVYSTSYYTTHPNVNTTKASTSTSGTVSTTSWRNTSTGAGGVNGVPSSTSGSGTTTTTAGVNVTPLTPPMTSTFTSRTTPAAGSTSDAHYGHHHHQHHQQQQQQQPKLPSIAQLERGPEMQPHYPRVSHRQYAYSNQQSSGYQSQRQTYLAHQGYLQPQQHQQHQHLPPLTPPDDIPIHIPHREQASFPQSSPLRPSSSSAVFGRPHVEESDEEEAEIEEEDETMQTAEDSESEEEEDVFMDASSSARPRRRDSPPSIAHETIPSSSIYTPAPTAILRAAPSTPPNYRASYATAAAPPPLTVSPVDTYAPPPTTAAPSSSSHPSYPIDWLDFTRTRSAHFIAEKTCEMICYLWFSSPPADAVGSEDDDKKGAGKEEVSLTSPMKPTYSSSNPPAKRPFSSTSPPSSLQLRTTPTFVSFMQKLLETTQVSQSVIVLSLHFIYRLKERNRFTPAQKGSEFRIGVAGLMMANKFLDDNTYTNKTWSEVSGIELEEINRMEREFLLGVDFNLYVDKPTYEAWLNLLKGLVWAKERDCRRVANGVGRGRHQQQHVRGRERERAGDKPVAKKSYTTMGSAGPSSRVFTTPSAAATTATTTKKTGRTGNPYPPTYRPSPRVRARSSSPTARSSVQGQTSYSSRKDYWAPDPHQQAYVYAPNNAAVGTSTMSASNSNMDVDAYTRATQTTYPTTSESHSAQAPPSPAPPVFSYTSSNSYAQPSSASSSAYTHQQPQQQRPSSKRTADSAFSPTSTASFALAQPSKRPVSMGGLSMNMNASSSGSHSNGASPLDGLQSFSRMSLGMGGSPSEGAHEREREREKERERVEREREVEAERERERERQKARPPPVTLSTAYSYDSHGRSPRVPQNLYFYTLACSPLKKDEVSSSSPASPSPSPFAQQPRYPPSQPQPENNAQSHVYPRAGQRKARLRYHQPSLSSSSSTAPYEYADLNASVRPAYPAPSTTSTAKYDPQGYHIAHPQPQLPRLVMPGSTSGAIGSSTTRYLSAANAGSVAPTATTNAHTTALPHFRDDVWAMPPAPAYTYPAPAAPAPKEEIIVYKQEKNMEDAPYSDSTTTEVYPPTSLATTHNIPSAPFANAGPPGVSFSYYPEADGNDSSSPSPVTLRSTRGNMADAMRVDSGNNIHRVGMMDDYLSSRRASASGVSGLSGYSSKGPPTASMSYADYRAGYSTANPMSLATTRSTSQNHPHAHVSGHGYTSGSYSTYASPVAYHSSTAALPASGGYASGGYACSSTTGNGSASGYPSGTYSAYASPHAGYGGAVER